MANKSGIHINPKNKGKFTASAKRAGEGVQAYASDVLSDPSASPTLKKRANFAKNAKKWNHGGSSDKGKMPPATRPDGSKRKGW